MPFTPPDAYRIASPQPGEDVENIDGPDSPGQDPTPDDEDDA